MTIHEPTAAAYQATAGSFLDIDKDLYRRIHDDKRHELVESFILPIRSGRAWKVPAGCLCRITVPEGPQVWDADIHWLVVWLVACRQLLTQFSAQVGDLNLWNFNDPRERMWAARTRQLHAAHVTIFDRLWSILPFLRPMVTITGDSLADYGKDGEGGRVHDLLGTRCDPYVNTLLTGKDFDYHCHSNLTRAVLPYGLTEFDVHDVLNVFQCTGVFSCELHVLTCHHGCKRCIPDQTCIASVLTCHAVSWLYLHTECCQLLLHTCNRCITSQSAHWHRLQASSAVIEIAENTMKFCHLYDNKDKPLCPFVGRTCVLFTPRCEGLCLHCRSQRSGQVLYEVLPSQKGGLL